MNKKEIKKQQLEIEVQGEKLLDQCMRIREETKKIRIEQEKIQSDSLKNMIPGRRGH